MNAGVRLVPDDRQIWTDFLAFLERERKDQLSQIRPLQSGEMRLGKRATDSGEWVDVTDDEIATLTRVIANLDRLMAQTLERLRNA